MAANSVGDKPWGWPKALGCKKTCGWPQSWNFSLQQLLKLQGFDEGGAVWTT